MNNWWLKLYTIPSLKILLKGHVAVCLLVCMAHVFLPKYVVYFYFLYFLTSFGFASGAGIGLGTNLEFHKMSVPLKDLRKAFYIDQLIVIFIHYITYALSFAIPVLIFAPSNKISLFLTFLSASPSIMILQFLMLVIVPLFLRNINLKIDPVKNQVVLNKKQKKTVGILLALAVSAVLIPETDVNSSEGFFSFLEQFNLLFIVLLVSGSFVVGSLIHYSRLNFHLFRGENFKQYFFSFGTGTFVSVLFLFFCGFVFRYEVNSRSISDMSKVKGMLVFTDFLPELETETVKEIMAVTSMFSQEVFMNANPEVFQIPVTEVIKEKNLYSYAKYLSYGKPSEENLIYIMKELGDNPKAKSWKEQAHYREVKYRLVQHWPAAKALPDRLIRAKIKIERRVASDKEDESGP